MGFDTGTDYIPLITLDLTSEMYGSGKNNTCHVRIPFTVDAGTLPAVTKLTLNVRYDDAFVAYLNGQEVTRDNFTGTPAWNSRADTALESIVDDFDAIVDISQYLNILKPGANILAIQLMNNSSTSTDLLLSVSMDAVAVKTTGAEYPYGDSVKLLNDLRVTELMYHAREGDTLDYIELQNVGDASLNLAGVRFTEGISFMFPALTLATRSVHRGRCRPGGFPVPLRPRPLRRRPVLGSLERQRRGTRPHLACASVRRHHAVHIRRWVVSIHGWFRPVSVNSRSRSFADCMARPSLLERIRPYARQTLISGEGDACVAPTSWRT